MKKDININISKKSALILISLFGLYASADFVVRIDAESAGGITILSGITDESFAAEVASLQSRIDSIEKTELPVGTIAVWASSTLPSGWLEVNGQSTSGYSELASIYGSSLPDMRGQFVRELDSGAGVDENSSRTLLSTQDDQIENITGSIHYIESYANGYPDGDTMTYGSFSASNIISSSTSHYVSGSGDDVSYALNFDSSRVVNSGDETRPVNVALMYIVKAE